MCHTMTIRRFILCALGSFSMLVGVADVFASSIKFSDAPATEEELAAPAPFSFRVSDYEDPEVKKRRQQSEELRSSCRKEAAVTAKTELGVRVLIDECEREHQKRLGE